MIKNTLYHVFVYKNLEMPPVIIFVDTVKKLGMDSFFSCNN